MVLYRQYRPDTFEQLVGQDVVKTALQRTLSSGRIAHAYLFSGPRGCGKTTSARIFARCLNCAEGPTPTPCGKCDSCKDLSSGASGSIDVIEMDAATHRGVDDARQLREQTIYAPSRDRYKIIILDEAHMITRDAFNALLKLVEEPPEHIKFIFATTEPEKLIGTIRSRTYHYAFKLVAGDILTPYLQDIAKNEQVKIDERVYPLLCRVGAGSVRDTLSYMDQLISSAKKDGSTYEVDYDFAVKLFGFVPTEIMSNVLTHLGDGNFSQVFDDITTMVSQGVSPRIFAKELLEWLRDAILVSIRSLHKATASIKAGLGERSDQEIKLLGEFSAKVNESQLVQYADILSDGILHMREVTSEKLQLELIIANFAATRFKTPTPAVIEPDSTKFAASEPVAPAPVSTPVSTPAPVENMQALTGSTTSLSASSTQKQQSTNMQVLTENVAKNEPAGTTETPSRSTAENADVDWDKVLGELQTIRKSAAILIKGQGKLQSVQSDVVTVEFSNPRFIETAQNGGYDIALTQALQKSTGKNLRVQFVSNTDTASTAPVSASPKASNIAEPSSAPTSAPAPVENMQALTEDVAEVVVEPEISDIPPVEPVDDVANLDELDAITDKDAPDISNGGLSLLQDVLGATEIKK